jgi:hypothetical protein
MSLSSKNLQKKRAKKVEKRKVVLKSKQGIGAAISFAKEWSAACTAPIADVLVPVHIFEEGIGNIWFSRRLPNGRYALVGFLVDTFCLGLKNALYKVLPEEEYQAFLDRIHSREDEEPLAREHPAYARKLIERAVAFARDLGFEPHADYKIASLIFGDVDAGACPASFDFGKNGEPYYICGPNDSPAFQRSVIRQLEKRCGPEGYHWLVGISGDDS